MSLRLVLTLILAIFVILRPAAADPASEHLDGVIDRIEVLAAEIDPDDPELKLERKLLKKIQKLLKKKSASLATDATLTAKIGKLVAKAGPEFGELGAEVAAAMDDIAANTDSLVSNLEFRLEDLPESKFRTKAEKALVKIRAILTEVDEDDLKALGKALKKALVKRRVAAKLINKAEKKLGEL
jgi:ElaB/YqjD/DUF883 family membrane-anchored ribosome-binding protein